MDNTTKQFTDIVPDTNIPTLPLSASATRTSTERAIPIWAIYSLLHQQARQNSMQEQPPIPTKATAADTVTIQKLRLRATTASNSTITMCWQNSPQPHGLEFTNTRSIQKTTEKLYSTYFMAFTITTEKQFGHSYASKTIRSLPDTDKPKAGHATENYFLPQVSRKVQPILNSQTKNPKHTTGFGVNSTTRKPSKKFRAKKLKAWFQFKPALKPIHLSPDDLRKGREPQPQTYPPLKIKVALSAVSTKGAIENLKKEAPHWNFEQYKANADQLWNAELSKIEIQADKTTMENFYTAMYHAFMHPVIYQDVDGKYRGLDQNIYTAEKFTNYTIFSLWDTFRALHPLFTIVQPQRTADMVNSMLAHQQQSSMGLLPIWSHYSNDNWCMTGYHATSVIADAIAKNIENIDIEKSLEAMKSTLYYPHYDHNMLYRIHGYMPHDATTDAASKTLEICYNDWAAYITATKTKNDKLARAFRTRADNYKNIFDRQTGFMRSKYSDKTWHEPFDALATHGQGYIEGNAYTYSLFVPHDIMGLSFLMGGDTILSNYLDTLFTKKTPRRKLRTLRRH
eukprot:TRINITY_DN13075_c0_g1_i1.p1 TRINITY_DN13075_c0_g1~~TRINITY_DN13075_c0_g1_i1.p1  ORF type:complete len:567 (-),score=16.35 TRINITY_DN13075_c0_g1_i1:135-1835(-)